MAELDDILGQFDYAETITQTIPGGGLTVTVAEAHHKRNRAFGRAMFQVMMREDVETSDDITEDIEIDVFCETLLKSWDMTRDGEPVPIDEASDIFKRNRAGNLLFREVGEIAATSANFLQEPSKKKSSSKPTTRKKPSGAKPKQSPAKLMPEAAKSQPASSDTLSEPATPG